MRLDGATAALASASPPRTCMPTAAMRITCKGCGVRLLPHAQLQTAKSAIQVGCVATNKKCQRRFRVWRASLLQRREAFDPAKPLSRKQWRESDGAPLQCRSHDADSRYIFYTNRRIDVYLYIIFRLNPRYRGSGYKKQHANSVILTNLNPAQIFTFAFSRANDAPSPCYSHREAISDVKNRSALKGAKDFFFPYSGVFIRHKFNRKVLASAASLALSAVALPAFATNWWTQTPDISIGSAVVNVRHFGAMGNGSTDDTKAIQAAVDALPSSGGTIDVPNGTYMINALEGISLRSHTRLSLASGAALKAIGNNARRYWVVKVWNVNNVEIVGGGVIGERYSHRDTTGGEWGYGINISSSDKVYVHDITVKDCWGDGLLIGALTSGKGMVEATNVTLNRVKAENNRRQGMSITPANRVYVVNSSFTGTHGTAPQSGIDIEPRAQGWASQVRLENTTLSDNDGNGLEVHHNVDALSLHKVTAENNKGFGVYTGGPKNVNITDSTLSQNYLFGVDFSADTSYVTIANNTINYNGDEWFYAHDESIFTKGTTPRDIEVADTAKYVTQSNNIVSPMR
ncbi:right-handed parallel beta-helix repeat-containing protein [Dyella humi]